ncbi:hypothetical protein KUTeg_005042, partial [Tegillarca granosa]
MYSKFISTHVIKRLCIVSILDLDIYNFKDILQNYFYIKFNQFKMKISFQILMSPKDNIIIFILLYPYINLYITALFN